VGVSVKVFVCLQYDITSGCGIRPLLLVGHRPRSVSLHFAIDTGIVGKVIWYLSSFFKIVGAIQVPIANVNTKIFNMVYCSSSFRAGFIDLSKGVNVYTCISVVRPLIDVNLGLNKSLIL